MLKQFVAAAGAALVLASAAPAAEPGAVLKGSAAFGDWQQDAPGVVRHITADDLPNPDPERSASNGPQTVARPEGVVPKVPPGFEVQLVASGVEGGPRAMRVAPNGDLFVANSFTGAVTVFRVPPGQAKPEQVSVFASGLHQPYGINFYPAGPDPKWVYVANSNAVIRFPYASGDLKAAGKPEVIVGNIPDDIHWTRDIVFSPDGSTMYLSVGSGSNVAEGMPKTPPGGLAAWIRDHALGEAWGPEAGRAAVWALTPEGKDKRIFATGLRNCAGMTMQPATGEPWCVVNERDALGDNVPFEYATHVEPGAWYGWPWYYIGSHEDPRHAGERPDLAGKATVPDVLMQAHSAPLNIVFYEGDMFPASYKGDAFVALHGSWNRGQRTGYKVVLLKFKDGKPTGEYEDFMTGFVLSKRAVWGRPVGVAVAKDGSLFVSEDGSGTIWRVSYSGK
jgi:glucose/arabinose dehydrogenase